MTQFTLHIFVSTVEHASRLYKEAAFTLGNGVCDRVAVLGFYGDGLALNEVTSDGLEIMRLPTVFHKNKTSKLLRSNSLIRHLFKVAGTVQYATACIRTARRLRPDHVSCHNALMLPVAWAAARLSGATLEYLPHELETERAGLGGLAKKLTIAVERWFIRSARHVVVVCDPIRDWYRSAYGIDNLHVVRNVPERGAVAIRPLAEPAFRERFSVPDTATLFIYQGQISIGRGVEELLEIFARLDPDRAHIVFMGYAQGGYQALIDAAVTANANIHFQPAVPRDQIVSYSSGADVGIFVVGEVPLNDRVALPNKFFEWVHAGVPVLVSNNLEYLSELAHDSGLGWSCPFDGTEAKIREICDTELAPFVDNVRQFATTAVWEEDAKAFTEVYRPVSGESGA